MANTETNRFENKEQLNDDFEQEVIAFLNYKEGGIIYVGIIKMDKLLSWKYWLNTITNKRQNKK